MGQPTLPLPYLALLPSPFQPGVNSLQQDAPLLLVQVPFIEALETEHDVDAHFVQYVVADGNDVISHPRINKPCLAEIRAQGGEVYLTVLAVDIDHSTEQQAHKAFSSDLEFQAFESDLASKLNEYPLLQNFAAYYSTRAGVRLIYVLSEPQPASIAEEKHKDLVVLFLKAGINADPACSDWTRLFRLPRVLRDREPQGKRSFDQLQLQPDARLDVAEIPRRPLQAKSYQQSPNAPVLDAPMPEDFIYTELMEEITESGKVKPSAWLKEAKRRLKNRHCYDCLFTNTVLAAQGARDATVHRYVGEACALLVAQPKTTAEHIYAMFLPAVLKLDTDAGTPDWRVPLWKAVCRYWPREVYRKQNEVEEEARVQQGKWSTIIEGMRQWCTDPRLLSTNEAEVRDFIQRHAILASRSSYFVLKPDGRYDTTSTAPAHLIAKIRSIGMDELLPTFTQGQNLSDKSIQGMLNQFVIPGYELDGVVDERDGTLSGKKLLRTLFRRKPIKPIYDERVDSWLRALAGEEYERLCQWIGLALAWDEGPICALSIKGPPGCGKKLLVQGLIECVDTEECSDVTEFSKFKSGIMKSPFLVVNEGFPDPRHMPMSPSDTFRAFVSGDPIRVEEKYNAPITVRNPLRIIFTTNNDDIIRALAGGRDLTPYDREAISQRLYHIDVREDAPRWLADVGGMDFTRGWIRGDAGSESHGTVAGHFMWLYSKRANVKAGRFLMEGTNNERLIKAMTLRSGAAPAVFEVLTRLIECSGKQKWGAVIEGNKVFVTEHHVEEYDQDMNAGGRKLNAHTIRTVFAAMRAPGTQPLRAVKGSNAQNKKLAVWHELNTKLILDEAIERGLPCAVLQRVVGSEVPTETPHGIEAQTNEEGRPRPFTPVRIGNAVGGLRPL